MHQAVFFGCVILVDIGARVGASSAHGRLTRFVFDYSDFVLFYETWLIYRGRSHFLAISIIAVQLNQVAGEEDAQDHTQADTRQEYGHCIWTVHWWAALEHWIELELQFILTLHHVLYVVAHLLDDLRVLLLLSDHVLHRIR